MNFPFAGFPGELRWVLIIYFHIYILMHKLENQLQFQVLLTYGICIEQNVPSLSDEIADKSYFPN